MVFYVAAGIYTVGVILFMLTADGELQSWAKDNEADNIIHLNTTLSRRHVDSDERRIHQSTRL